MPLPGLTIRPDARWTGTTPTVSDNAAGHEIPSYYLLNLALRWRIGHIGLFVTGTNLSDERWLKDANSYSAFAGSVVSLGERRRVSGGIEFEF
jgi:outer membrane receptor protein involved in Fe transport